MRACVLGLGFNVNEIVESVVYFLLLLLLLIAMFTRLNEYGFSLLINKNPVSKLVYKDLETTKNWELEKRKEKNTYTHEMNCTYLIIDNIFEATLTTSNAQLESLNKLKLII